VLGQHEIAPGASTTLKIVYRTYKFPGKFKKYVTVVTEAPEKETHKITLAGYVEPIPMAVMEVNPRKIDAGTMKAGQDHTVPLVMANTGDAPMKITKVYSKKFKTVYFEAPGDNPLVVGPGQKTAVALTLKPSETGRYLDYVMIDAEARNVTDKGYKVVVVGTVQ